MPSSSATAAPAANIIVNAVTSNLLLVHDTQNASCGLFHVYYNSSTTFSPAKPVVGNAITVTGSGTCHTSITATAVTIGIPTPAPGPAPHIIVDSVASNLLLVHDTLAPSCGHFHVNYNSSTSFAPTKPVAGNAISVTGSGSCATSITATAVTVGTGTSPTPAPTAAPTAVPTVLGTSVPTAAPASGGTVSAFQIFDYFGPNQILSSAKVADGSRYTNVWGATGPSYWRSNSNTNAAYYIPMSTDFNVSAWGGNGHNLTWWQANHPDWILYSCTSSGTPTTQVTYQSGWTGQVPLDIHNPQVVSYLVNTAIAYAKAKGYNAIAIDQVLLFNATWDSSTGMHGCGIYSNGQFVQRYTTNQDDPNYAADVVAWVKQAKSLISASGLKMIVNSPHTSSLAPTTNDAQIVTNTDYDLDETGFTDYGKYASYDTIFAQTFNWTVQAQKMGAWVLSNNEFSGTTPLNSVQREYVVSAYLLANEGRLSMFAGPSNSYGAEQYMTEYTKPYGAACADATSSGTVYSRHLQNAYVLLNAAAASATVTLPTNHTYTDLEGRPVTNPLVLGSHDARVLMTTGGCS